MEKFYNMSADAVMRDMKTDANGLSSAQAEERLAKYGQNKLAEAKKPGILKRFFMQLGDPMLIILLVAAGVSALTGMLSGESEWADTIIILVVVLLNAVLGVIQESKSCIVHKLIEGSRFNLLIIESNRFNRSATIMFGLLLAILRK